MPTEVIMPKVDMDMTHGTFATWHVAEGARVAQGAPLFDIETEKAAMEVEAPVAGRLHHVAAQPGDRIAVGTAIAWLYAEGEEIGPPPGGPEPKLEIAVAQKPAVAALPARDHASPARLPPEPAIPAGPAAVRATPAARAAARAAGLGLEDIPGTGPLGRVQRDDVVGLRDFGTPAKRVVAGAWTPESGALHVTRRPGTGMPILLIHGFAADSQSWAPLERAFGEGPRLIRIDLPGHGRSPRRRVASFQALARMLVETVDEVLGAADRVHLVGHSLGGALALAISDVRPRKVASLTMIAPAGLGPEIDAEVLGGIARASRVESLAPWLRRLTSAPQPISDHDAPAAFRTRPGPDARSFQVDLGDVLFPDGVQSFDLRPALRRLELPAQIIWGRDDHILPLRQAISAGGEVGLFLIEAAGHIPQVERPDRVARIVLRLAAAVEAVV